MIVNFKIKTKSKISLNILNSDWVFMDQIRIFLGGKMLKGI